MLVLGPVSIVFDSTSFTAILGPSGCGKSTLVRVIAGLQRATSGHVSVDGRVIQSPQADIGMMFQDANLMPWRTLRENIALPLELAGISKAERLARTDAILPGLGLSGFAEAYPSELSGGMAQRVALGRILIQEPRVLLLDEPFGALDSLTREQISLDLLHIWYKARQTAIMVTHDINEAVLLADRILVMSRRPGRFIADIRVPLDRPREIDMMYSDAFIATARQVRAAIEQA